MGEAIGRLLQCARDFEAEDENARLAAVGGVFAIALRRRAHHRCNRHPLGEVGVALGVDYRVDALQREVGVGALALGNSLRGFDCPDQLGGAIARDRRKACERRPQNVRGFMVRGQADEESRLIETVSRVLDLINERKQVVPVADAGKDLARGDGQAIALPFDLLGASGD